MRRVVRTKILRCFRGCNALLLPVESLVIATHQSLVNPVATLGGIAPFQLEFGQNLTLGGFCNSYQIITKIRYSWSARPALLNSVFADVGSPLGVEIDQVGSSCTVLSV